MDWLYPVRHCVNEETGYEWDEYDTSRCLLDEGTWVTIQAEVQLEVTDKTQDIDNANHTVAFPMYIDVTSPKSNGKDCNQLWSETWDNQWAIDAGMIPPEEYHADSLVYCRSSWDEQWFLDYTMEALVGRRDGQWFGSMMSMCMLNIVPGQNYGFSQLGLNVSRLDGDGKYLAIGADYAGNAYAKEIHLDSRIQNYVNLEADSRILQVGDTLTIRDVQDNDFSTKLEWKLSNSDVAEIVATDDHSCTIRALACGKVTVRGGLGLYPDTVDLYVTNSTREEVAHRFPDIQGHWAAEDVITAVQMGLPEPNGNPRPIGHTAVPPGRRACCNRQWRLPGCGGGPVLCPSRGLGRGAGHCPRPHGRDFCPLRHCHPGRNGGAVLSFCPKPGDGYQRPG